MRRLLDMGGTLIEESEEYGTWVAGLRPCEVAYVGDRHDNDVLQVWKPDGFEIKSAAVSGDTCTTRTMTVSPIWTNLSAHVVDLRQLFEILQCTPTID